MTIKKHWRIAERIRPEASAALKAYSPLFQQILYNRGISSEEAARAFLRAEPPLPAPHSMRGIDPAVDRILYALDHSEAVAVYGDYDVDGVTATALLVLVMRALGMEVQGYIPNRFDEGYGLNHEALDVLKSQGVRLVITVDCGIRSHEEVAYAREIGLDLILTDHHQPAQGDLPQALAIINPKQAQDDYPDKDLAGVGLAYKLAQALLDRHPVQDFVLENQLDLVALGTVADLAPLSGENRFLVRRGLEQMRFTRRQGLFSLANVAELSLANLTATNINFILGPRLNAAGRLDSARAAFELLITEDVSRAALLAQQLEMQNRERQTLTRNIQEQAEQIVQEDDPEALLLFAVHQDFNAGVVGLAASRLVETYYRPAVVGQVSEETTRCSCRSIPELHITQALDQCADLLVRHGGHAAAAGFTVRNENLVALRNRLMSIVTNQLSGRELRPTLKADAEVRLTDLNSRLLQHLDDLQPTGFGNPEAVFVTRSVRIASSRSVGADGKHLKLSLTDGSAKFDAIGFRLGHLHGELSGDVDVLYTFETNEYNGRSSMQLNIRDIKPSGDPD